MRAADVPALIRQPLSRRRLLASAVVGAAGSTFLGAVAGSRADATPPASPTRRITVLGSSDLHGHIENWDYYNDREYDDSAHNDVGVAKIATLVKAMRAERGAGTTITLDAGDTIQGTPLTYYYAAIDPITASRGPVHPMAAAMNAVGYDAACLGNHEFNYGVPLLRKFASQLRHPLLGANALDWNTGQPAFPSFVVKTIRFHGREGDTGHGNARGNSVKVGIVGFVTPGCQIWDKANLEGRIRMTGIVEQAKEVIPQVKAAGADVVIVSCHSGMDTSSSYGDALPWPENASTLLAQEVPGIDAILVGHAHSEIPQRFVTNTATGRQVLLSEPYYWGMRLTVMDLDLRFRANRWEVVDSAATLLNANTVAGDPTVLRVTADAHQRVRRYVNSVIGTATQAMSAATARYEDTPAIDFINHVQADAVEKGLQATGSPAADLPVLSIAAPFNKLAAIPQGQITVKDVAGLYIYDNTLLAIQFTGAQVKDYLEFSARYFQQVTGTGPFTSAQVCNAVTPTAPNGTPDYNYDIMGGLDAPLTYDIDISQPVGSRILDLRYDGTPVDPAAQFVVAINNYRQSGGGGFPGVTTAPVVINQQQPITQLLIQWVTDQGTVDPTTFASDDWQLVSGGQPITVTP
ncbi:bifunctional metallophosphatase/5'-nucleotidase [Jatrophihabitans sp. YIM 134969]